MNPKQFVYVKLTTLRSINAKKLREIEKPQMVCFHNQPIAALVPYDLFMKMWIRETQGR